jgi:fructokinase
LVLGEVLFDYYPNGQRVLGGAPFNVAWNLVGVGLDPTLVTAVGDDEDGRVVLRRMREWGLATEHVHVSTRYPTGRAVIGHRNGEPVFELPDKQAYDDIAFPEDLVSAAPPALLYHGSLAFRRDPSRATIRRMIAESGAPRFVDINIRQPWFDQSIAAELLRGAEWTKLSAGELELLTGKPCGAATGVEAAVRDLRRQHGGRSFFVTRGGLGAVAIDADGFAIAADSPRPEPFVGTVGAGDAFAAATIRGIGLGLDLHETLQTAVAFASRTCTIQGATSLDRGHYRI